jgi:hypothetical protein
MYNKEKQEDKQLAERIEKLEPHEVMAAKAFVQGMETGKAIYEASKETEKQEAV